MKILLISPDFYQSAVLLNNAPRTFNNLNVTRKILDIFEKQKDNNFYTVPNYRCWKGYEEALKVYSNCLLKVCKEIYNYNTKYEYLDINEQSLIYPKFTDLTFKSHKAFLYNLAPNLYKNFQEYEDFNGNILIWEYIDKKGISVAEDRNGIFKIEKLEDKFKDIVKNYNLEEINKKNILL